MALAPNNRYIYAQLRSEPYPLSTFAIDHTTGKLTHLDATPLVDQTAYINVDKTGKYLLGASYVGAKVAVYPIDARYIVEDKATQIVDTGRGHIASSSTPATSMPMCRCSAPTMSCSSSSIPAPAC
jgi:6-phosphogluconolactonase